ncbi:photosystem II assembly protein Psb35 [Trichothermofontia sp.]
MISPSLIINMAVAGAGPHFPLAFTLVYVVGFIAAVTIGSIAWYNSKRPPGWEGRERPNIVPKVKSLDEDNS